VRDAPRKFIPKAGSARSTTSCPERSLMLPFAVPSSLGGICSCPHEDAEAEPEPAADAPGSGCCCRLSQFSSFVSAWLSSSSSMSSSSSSKSWSSDVLESSATTPPPPPMADLPFGRRGRFSAESPTFILLIDDKLLPTALGNLFLCLTARRVLDAAVRSMATAALTMPPMPTPCGGCGSSGGRGGPPILGGGAIGLAVTVTPIRKNPRPLPLPNARDLEEAEGRHDPIPAAAVRAFGPEGAAAAAPNADDDDIADAARASLADACFAIDADEDITVPPSNRPRCVISDGFTVDPRGGAAHAGGAVG
jgi:hypothetical protein